MTEILCRACRIAAVAGLLTFASPALAQPSSTIASRPMPAPAAKMPKITVLCLPPRGSKPVRCGTATRATVLKLRLERAATKPPRFLIFRALGAVGNARVASVNLQPKWFLDHAQQVKVPSQLCDGAAGQQFEIQILTADMNQAESASDAHSIGFFQMRC